MNELSFLLQTIRGCLTRIQHDVKSVTKIHDHDKEPNETWQLAQRLLYFESLLTMIQNHVETNKDASLVLLEHPLRELKEIAQQAEIWVSHELLAPKSRSGNSNANTLETSNTFPNLCQRIDDCHQDLTLCLVVVVLDTSPLAAIQPPPSKTSPNKARLFHSKSVKGLTFMGIDLGTRKCAAAVWDVQHDQPVMIPNEYYNYQTPSSVALGETDYNNEMLVGESAYFQMGDGSSHIFVYDTKRLIGKSLQDARAELDKKQWAFPMVVATNHDDDESSSSSPSSSSLAVQVTQRGHTLRYSPIDIASLLLKKMKQMAQDHLQCQVDGACITVPAWYGLRERYMIHRAAAKAGFPGIRLVTDTTVASMDYARSLTGDEQNVLVIDLGAGNLSASLCTIEDGVLEVKATAGDGSLGGMDFDRAILDLVMDELGKTQGMGSDSWSAAAVATKDIRQEDYRRLWAACERAKIALSTHTSAVVHVPFFTAHGVDLAVPISREQFDQQCAHLLPRMENVCEQVLRSAKIAKNQIHKVAFMGGSRRIPCVRACLSNFFGEKKTLRELANPEQAVALNAATHAAVISEMDKRDVLHDFILLDVIPKSLGIEIAGGLQTNLVPRNFTVPAKRTASFTTYIDNQTSFSFRLFEGESSMVKDNTFLGVLNFNGIPPSPRGQVQLDVTVDIDANFSMNLIVVDKHSGKTAQCKIDAFAEFKCDAATKSKTLLVGCPDPELHFDMEAERYKQEGDHQYRLGCFLDAVELYSICIQLLNGDDTRDIVRKAHSNRAACNRKLGEHQSVIDDCTWILNHDSSDVKALLRRAESFQAQEEWARARQDVERILSTPTKSITKDILETCKQIQLAVLQHDDDDGCWC